jgi:chromosome segregation ATPase
MARRDLVTRDDLRRSLVANALTKPVNVAVPAAVVIAGLLLGTWWLLPLAALVYLVLAAMTFFDEDEAKAVGERRYGRDKRAAPRLSEKSMAPKIREYLDAARSERAAIDRTISQSDLPFQDVAQEVDSLLAAVEATARRAQRVHDHLMTRPQGTAQGLRSKLRGYHDEMAAVVRALREVHDRLVEASLANEEERDAQLAGDVRDLRARVDAATEGLGEAYTPS